MQPPLPALYCFALPNELHPEQLAARALELVARAATRSDGSAVAHRYALHAGPRTKPHLHLQMAECTAAAEVMETASWRSIT